MKIENTSTIQQILHTPKKDLEDRQRVMTSAGGILIVISAVVALILGFKFLTGFMFGFVTATTLVGGVMYGVAIAGQGFKKRVKDKYVFVRSKGKGKYRGL